MQARGQLRLTWRLYAESPQSGEISPPLMVRAALRGRSLGSEYHGIDPRLSPIPARTSARDDDVGERPSRHFDRSEAEWRNLLPLMVRAALRREISRLRASWERFPSAPYRHKPPLEMTMLASTSGHTFGVRVHKVQRVQRVVVAASPQILKKAGPRPPSFRRKPVSRQ